MAYIDLHVHALPGLDDGVKDELEALALLQSAVNSHIDVVVLAPHKEPQGRFDHDNATILKAAKHLKKLASTHKIPVTLLVSEELRIKTDTIEVIRKGTYLTLEGTDYVQIELTRTNAQSKLIDQAIAELKAQGKKIIIVHPERYFDEVSEGLEYIKKWVEAGCVMELNRTSLLNLHGEAAYKLSHKLIKIGLAHVVASDAHQGSGVRVCRLDDVQSALVKNYSAQVAELLLSTNPKRILNNEPPLSIVKPKKRWLTWNFRKENA
jgi:protein-tyrosine phosphatase